MQEDDLKTEQLGHLGLVSSAINDLGLVDKLNSRIPLDKKKGGKISYGHRAAAMILNGLGYVTRTLYLSPHFFNDKPLDLLLGIECEADDFNDDMLGRLLDKIAAYGTTQLFSELSFEIAQEQGLLKQRSYHLDTTTLRLYGDYLDYPNALPLPLQGYSKDHRPDLKQVTLSLTQLGESQIPLWFEALNGNSSDKTSFQETVRAIQSFQQALKQAPDTLFFVVDAAFYTPEKLAALSQVKWITRVPATHKQAKLLLHTPSDELTWTDVGKGNQLTVKTIDYAGFPQRWVMVSSAQAKQRALQTFYKRCNKSFQATQKQLWHLSNQTFACQTDAEQAIGVIHKKLKHLQLHYTIEPVMKFAGKGRPRSGDKPACVGYQISFALASDLASIHATIDTLGRFILATNELDETILSHKDVLIEYKSQTHVEAGFRFLKSDEFELNHIFLKNPNRIGALMMIMTLCLMVYNFAQYRLRENLEKNNILLPNQLGKPINNPTLRWVFQIMIGITVVCVWDKKTSRWHKRICNIKNIQKVIVSQFGSTAKAIYGLPCDWEPPDYDRKRKPLHLWMT